MKQLSALLLLLATLTCSAHASGQPNIIVILVDDMGPPRFQRLLARQE